MRKILVLGAGLIVLGVGHDASAHAFLLKSDPVVGATIAAPKTIRLEFSEAVELALSGVDLASGARNVAIPKAHFNGSDHKVLLTDLPTLQPGAYRVKWHVVSVDSHRTEGDYVFTVKP
jgi:methionine-rich copper-binding protein CopC